ncbi:hypothetical protein M422DRAFT_40473 [Sphaerobolus stellatus SS14]|nr:hypothetical protein M422DRAFT_40473 [Sphaerobolus stellatus SS14]
MAEVDKIIPTLPPARAIPVTFKDSFRSCTDKALTPPRLSVGDKQSAASEERLLRDAVPYFFGKDDKIPTPPPPVIAQSFMVPLSNPSHFINTVAIKPATPSNTPPVVLLHGYGAGLGFYFRNFAAVGAWAERRQTPVYALDWLGMGRSARPLFKVKAKRQDIQARVEQSEAFFVDSLEDWRERMGIERMTLVGHSLGGYFSTAYALKYPERVARVVLLSPAGVPGNPDETTQPSRELDANPADPSATGQPDISAVKQEQKTKKRQEGTLRRVATHLWEEGWSPFQVVRSTMFWGPMIVGKYSARRFSGLSEEQTRNIHDYIVNITLAKGSGEYCISHILAPGAHARLPLVDRVAPLKMPVTFVYGEHDWMDPEGGLAAVQNLRAAGNKHSKLVVVPGAGHHVYLDNHNFVNDLMIKEFEKTIPRGER